MTQHLNQLLTSEPVLETRPGMSDPMESGCIEGWLAKRTLFFGRRVARLTFFQRTGHSLWSNEIEEKSLLVSITSFIVCYYGIRLFASLHSARRLVLVELISSNFTLMSAKLADFYNQKPLFPHFSVTPEGDEESRLIAQILKRMVQYLNQLLTSKPVLETGPVLSDPMESDCIEGWLAKRELIFGRRVARLTSFKRTDNG